MARVLILGGGFGGLAAAHELRQRLPEDDEVVLVARDDTFVMGFAKLWDLVGWRSLADSSRSLTGLASRGVTYVQAEITGIDPEAVAVATSDGEHQADAMLVALGCAPFPEHTAQLDGKVAHDLYDAGALPAIRRALADFQGGRLVVAVMGVPFKCPPAPYEAAFLLDEHLRARGVRDATELVVATPQPATLPAAGPAASAMVADALRELGAELRFEQLAPRVEAGARRVTFRDGDELDFDLFLGVPQNVPLPVLADSPLAGGGGWIAPDRSTLRTAFERVYAAGDCTIVPTATKALPKAGVFAERQAKVAAANIAADLGHGERATFDGHGFCFLEFPAQQAAFVQGDFFAEPKPAVELTPPSTETFEAKLAFERERLQAWLG